jgi:hypothetical protein
MAPKRGDTKTQDGKKYRYAYKDGKLMWVRDRSGFNPKIGDKLKIAGKNIKKFGGKVTQKVFGTPNKKQNFNAPTGTKSSNKKMAEFREDPTANKKLQKEYKSGKDITYSRRLSSKAKNQIQETKKSTTTVKRGKSSIEAKNRARLGDARVDKLKAKNKDFQAMKKGKMTKAQFIKKYPNSQTAKKARK